MSWMSPFVSRMNRSIAPSARAIAVGAMYRVMPSIVAVMTPVVGAAIEVQAPQVPGLVLVRVLVSRVAHLMFPIVSTPKTSIREFPENVTATPEDRRPPGDVQGDQVGLLGLLIVARVPSDATAKT